MDAKSSWQDNWAANRQIATSAKGAILDINCRTKYNSCLRLQV